MLADTVDTLETVPEALRDPSLSRLHACSAIVNALSLALNCDRYSQDSSRFGSRLLHDPTPELMTEVLSRTGKAIFSLHEAHKLPSSTAQTMLSVIFCALTVLSQVSMSSTLVLSSLQHINSKHKLKIRSEDPRTPMTASAEDLAILSKCDYNFVDEFLQEMQINASLDPSSLDKTIQRFETTACRTGENLEELRPMDSLVASVPVGLWSSRYVALHSSKPRRNTSDPFGFLQQ